MSAPRGLAVANQLLKIYHSSANLCLKQYGSRSKRTISATTRAPQDEHQENLLRAPASPAQTPSSASVPIQSASPHNSLTTFLAHADRAQLAPSSTTYLGTRYEYLTQSHLAAHYAFTLTRVGGRNDAGIDLLGHWAVPSLFQPPACTQTASSTPDPSSYGSSETSQLSLPAAVEGFPVVVQCKRLAPTRRPSPSMVRELEGSFRGAPRQWRSDSALGVLVCSRPATKGVRDAMGRSERGLVWICLEEDETEALSSSPSQSPLLIWSSSPLPGPQIYSSPKVYVRQMLWNHAAIEYAGLQGLGVSMKHSTDARGNAQSEAVLLWRGQAIGWDPI